MNTTALAADNASRAVAAYGAMQSTFYHRPSKLYRERSPYDPTHDQPNSYLWSFEEAVKAIQCIHGMPGAAGRYASDLQDRLTAREQYWDGNTRQRAYRSYPNTGDRYFDDNCWAGSDLVQHHLLTGKGAHSAALDRARGVFSYLAAGWTTNLPKPGGVRWVDASFNGDRAIDSTAGWAKLGAHLYDVTGRRTPSYLDWAVHAYDWSKQHLLASNGLYANSMRADGTVDPTQWIYNQGIVIGAAVLLHRVTNNSTYVLESTRLADSALVFFGTDPYYSGTMGAYAGRGIFNAIFFRNLLMLYAVTRNDTYLQKMQAYADAVWSDPALHNQQTNLYRLNGETRYSLLDQAGMAQVFALLNWNVDAYSKLA